MQRPAQNRTEVAYVAERARELTARAARLRRRGEIRRAVVTLREACALDEADAARWMQLGHLLSRAGKRDEARAAMKQSLFLREQEGAKKEGQCRAVLTAALGPSGGRIKPGGLEGALSRSSARRRRLRCGVIKPAG